MTTQGDLGTGRWCDHCQYRHGWLYPCEHFDQDTLAAIAAEAVMYRRYLSDPEWCTARGWTRLDVQIFRAMAGMD